MSRYLSFTMAVFFFIASLACNTSATAAEDAFVLPDPALDAPLAGVRGEQSIVLAGGCF